MKMKVKLFIKKKPHPIVKPILTPAKENESTLHKENKYLNKMENTSKTRTPILKSPINNQLDTENTHKSIQ